MVTMQRGAWHDYDYRDYRAQSRRRRITECMNLACAEQSSGKGEGMT